MHIDFSQSLKRSEYAHHLVLKSKISEALPPHKEDR